MGFFLLNILLALTYVRPWDFVPELAEFRLPFWVGNLALLSAVVAFLASGRYSLLKSPGLYLMIMFFTVLVLSPATAVGWFGAIPIAFTRSMSNIINCVLILLTARTLGRMRTLGGTLCVLSLWLAVQGALAYHGLFASEQLVATQRTDEVIEETGVRGEFARVVGMGQFHDANDLAQALIAACPLLWPFWREGRRVRNFVLVVLPTMMLMYGVFLTRSRGAILAIIVVVGLRTRERMTRFRNVGPALLAGCLAVAMVAAGFTGGRSMGGDASSEGRIEAWYEGLQMLKAHPVFGVGYAHFTEHHERAAHNSFVHCFAELGLLGYFAWIGMLVAVHTDLFQMRQVEGGVERDARLVSWASALRYSLYAFLAGAFFLSRTYAMILYVIVGLAIALGDIARSSGELDPPRLRPLFLHTCFYVVGSIAGIWVITKVA